MDRFETLDVAGYIPAITGMRAPLKSYEKKDSYLSHLNLGGRQTLTEVNIGENDYKLAKRLCQSGPEHRKWMRQIQVWGKISMPLYWWSEFDTYKIGTSANSESTMHTLAKRKLEWEDFDTEYLYGSIGEDDLAMAIRRFNQTLERYNKSVEYYKKILNEDHNTADWDASDEEKHQRKIELSKNEVEVDFIALKSLLPTSFIQTRYVNLNYEVLHNMYHQRKNHRLPQWSKDFVSWVKTLPYSEFITEEFDS